LLSGVSRILVWEQLGKNLIFLSNFGQKYRFLKKFSVWGGDMPLDPLLVPLGFK
jgi:hypothetical protein